MLYVKKYIATVSFLLLIYLLIPLCQSVPVLPEWMKNNRQRTPELLFNIKRFIGHSPNGKLDLNLGELYKGRLDANIQNALKTMLLDEDSERRLVFSQSERSSLVSGLTNKSSALEYLERLLRHSGVQQMRDGSAATVKGPGAAVSRKIALRNALRRRLESTSHCPNCSEFKLDKRFVPGFFGLDSFDVSHMLLDRSGPAHIGGDGGGGSLSNRRPRPATAPADTPSHALPILPGPALSLEANRLPTTELLERPLEPMPAQSDIAAFEISPDAIKNKAELRNYFENLLKAGK